MANSIKPYFGIFEKLKKLDIFDNSLVGEDLYGPDLADFYDLFACDYVADIPIFERYIETGSRILDLACGSGRIGFSLASKGCYVDGLELSVDMLKLAEKQLKKVNPAIAGKLQFIQGNMSRFALPYKYDLIVIGVTSISLIIERTDRLNLYQCAYQHLNNGGRLIFDLVDHDKHEWTSDVWSKETEYGLEYAIVGQKMYYERSLFVFNIIREVMGWDGETRRYIGSSTKAILDLDTESRLLQEAQFNLEETIELGSSIFIVAKKGVLV